ncbi:MAG: hypothetical protein ATN33_07230 [Epulopiscium sp. Nele67-Bin001]|nr:MAG: hypothetical protein ATN33_07230 [Epulopiscium sp. Nele67-Bin001]
MPTRWWARKGKKMLKNFDIKNYRIDIALFAFMIGVNLITGGFSSISGAICSLCGVLCVLMVARGNIWNFAFGIINVSLYIFIAWEQKFFGEVMLNAFYYLPVNLFGYFIWKRNMQGNHVKAKNLLLMKKLQMMIVCIIAIFTYGYILQNLGGNNPYLDSMSTVLSIVAQLLMLLMYSDQWLLWIIVNVVSVIMWGMDYYVTRDIIAIQMTAMWFAYLLNAINGYVRWLKMAKETEENGDISEEINTAVLE